MTHDSVHKLNAKDAECIHLNEAFCRWVEQFHKALLDPNLYRPPSFGIFKKNGQIIEPLNFDDSEYSSSAAASVRLNFEIKIKSLTAFTDKGEESSPGQWDVGEGGFEKIVIRDDTRNDGGPLSWPGLSIRPYDVDVWINLEKFEALTRSEQEWLLPKCRISDRAPEDNVNNSEAVPLRNLELPTSTREVGVVSKGSNINDILSEPQRKRPGRKKSTYYELGRKTYSEWYDHHGGIDTSDAEANAQARIEESIQKKCGVAQSTARRWIKRFDLDREEQNRQR